MVYEALGDGKDTTTVLRPVYPGPPRWASARRELLDLWCKGRLTEADTLTIRLGATPSGLTSAHLHHPHFFTAQMPFKPPNQQCQSVKAVKANGKDKWRKILSQADKQQKSTHRKNRQVFDYMAFFYS